MTKFVRMLAGCLVLLIAVPISIQAQNATVPDVCIIETPTNESLRACADATPEGSQPNAWAHTYLGANAYMEGNLEQAAFHFRHSYVTDQPDLWFNPDVVGLRSATFHSVGDRERSLRDAETLFGVVTASDEDLALSFPDWEITDDVRAQWLATILQPLYEYGSPNAQRALEMWTGFPPGDIYDVTNRASVLTELGEYEEALRFSDLSIEMAPGFSPALNTRCYLLGLLERFDEALPNCSEAVRLEPQNAAFRHSYSVSLAGRGACDMANEQLREARRLTPSNPLYREAIACTPR
jgi:tetratricopeptide (TPR) repeat protein